MTTASEGRVGSHVLPSSSNSTRPRLDGVLSLSLPLSLSSPSCSAGTMAMATPTSTCACNPSCSSSSTPPSPPPPPPGYTWKWSSPSGCVAAFAKKLFVDVPSTSSSRASAALDASPTEARSVSMACRVCSSHASVRIACPVFAATVCLFVRPSPSVVVFSDVRLHFASPLSALFLASTYSGTLRTRSTPGARGITNAFLSADSHEAASDDA
mmetsp:Transcript_3704/g.9902  ORF Transcript_3704/g.9902 Transcript_3704/m.9902 type:complete len:212 (+) Transcript_3704:1297-1932(+)